MNEKRVAKKLLRLAKECLGVSLSDEASELLLYINNDAQLYRQQFIPIVKNLMLKRAKGIYDSLKAVKLFMYLVDAGAKKYIKEFGSPGDSMRSMFPKSVRLKVAEELRDDFEDEADLGNWDDFIPAKYQV